MTYVWFDALLNYVSIFYPDHEKFHKYWSQVHHIIGKDILKTHAIYWPCMLKAAKMQPFRKLVVHGHWVSSGSKMSKSLGNVVDPLAMKELLGVDGLRYFLLRDMSFGEDANFTEELAITRYNADLANNIGNLLNRSINLSQSNFDGKVPPLGAISNLEQQLNTDFKAGVEKIQEHVANFHLHRALEHIAWLSSQVNIYLQNCAPWQLAQQEEQRERLGTVLYTALDTGRILIGLLAPVMPQKTTEAAKALGLNASPTLDALQPGELVAGTKLPKPQPLFPKIKPLASREKNIEIPVEKKVKKNKKELTSNEQITIDDFNRVQLKTGTILHCQRIDGADKLLHSQVDLGEEQPRSIVSGVAQTFRPEELIGKKVLVVSNLQSVTLRGISSEGMILFGEHNSKFTLLQLPEELPSGATIR